MTDLPKIKMTIPGQMTEQELLALARIARTVPPGGRIVEIGSLYGLSSWHWAQNADPTVSVHCIDPWVREPWIVQLVETPQGAPTFCREAFEANVSDCPNVVPHQGYSPRVCADWDEPIQVFFDDAVHENPTLRANIDFWKTFVVPGGVVCGHDYGGRWPDVVTEADRLADEWAASVERVETFWWITRPAC